MKYQESKSAKFFAGKGFYLVLSLCLVAVGAAAWIAVSSLSKPPVDVIENSSDPSLVTSQQDESQTNVGAQVSDVEDTRSETPNTSSTPETPSSEPETTDVNTAPVANYFVLPVTGEIIKGFSDTELQYSETYKDLRLHTGVDIACEAGSAVKAAGDGVVHEIKEDPNWGVTIIIDHGNGIKGYYSGLNQKPLVHKGDTVASGTQLGSVDEIPAECLDQSHLHLAFTKNDAYVSPLELIGME